MKEEHLSDYKAQEYNVLYVYLSSKKSECTNTILLYKLELFLNAKTRFFYSPLKVWNEISIKARENTC